MLYLPARSFTHFSRLNTTEVAHRNVMATKASKGAQASKGAAAPKKKMSQSEIIAHFSDRFELKKPQVKEMFEELAQLAQREVQSNGEFTVPGFGKMVLSQRSAREGRNPATGETITIPAKTTLKFRLGKAMKDSVVPAKK